MKNYITTTLITLTVLITGVIQVNAGTLYPTHVPGETMYSLQEIYNLVTASTTSNLENGQPFNRPASVNNSMVNLEQLYNAILVLKNSTSTTGGGDDDGGTATSTRSEDGRLYVSSSNDDLDATIFNVQDDEKSDEKAIFVFNLEAEESDINIETVQIEIETNSANVENVVSDFILEIEGEQYDDWSYVSGASSTNAVIDFDIDGDFELDIDENVTIVLLAEFNSADGIKYNSGETIKASIANEAITGEDLDGVISSGIAEGNTHELLTAGIIVNISNSSVDEIGDNGGVARFQIEFDVEAFEESFYVSQFASTTSDKGISFSVEGPGTPQNIEATLESTADEDTSGVFTIQEGEVQTFDLTVTVSNVDITGQYKLVLDSIGYTKNSNGISEIIIKDIDNADFSTDYGIINAN